MLWENTLKTQSRSWYWQSLCFEASTLSLASTKPLSDHHTVPQARKQPPISLTTHFTQLTHVYSSSPTTTQQTCQAKRLLISSSHRACYRHWRNIEARVGRWIDRTQLALRMSSTCGLSALQVSCLCEQAKYFDVYENLQKYSSVLQIRSRNNHPGFTDSPAAE